MQVYAGSEIVAVFGGLWCSYAHNAFTMTRSPAEEFACKGLGRDGLSPGHHAQGRLHSDS